MNERLLNILNRDWQAFLNSFDGLPDDSLFLAGVIGAWSIRDIMGHITTWEEEVLKALPLILAGEPTPSYDKYGGIDTFNAHKVAEKSRHTLAQTKIELKTTHQRLIDRISEIPDDAVNPRFEQRFGEDTWDHYCEHAEQIRIWRKNQSLT